MPIKASDLDLFDRRQRKPQYFLNAKKKLMKVSHGENHTVTGNELNFYKPNIIGLFVNMSDKQLHIARELYLIIKKMKPMSQQKPILSRADTKIVYDYLEAIQTSIMSIYSAVEAMANAVIPSEYEYNYKDNKGVIHVYNHTAIERWQKTKDKLKLIIPKALNIPSPATYKSWSKFLELEDLRNEIIHNKTSTHLGQVDPKFEGETSGIIRELLSPSVFDKVRAAKDLIQSLNTACGNHPELPLPFEEFNFQSKVFNTTNELKDFFQSFKIDFE
jgi:hypothetical protein